MRYLLTIAMILIGLVGCSQNPEDSEPGYGYLTLEAFDNPPPEGVEEINLHILEVKIHSDVNGWVTLSEPDTVINFLDLVNGATVLLVDDSLLEGYYSQARLVLSDTNEIVIYDVAYPLTVPSGQQSGLKLNLDFDLHEGDLVELYVDFDISKAIVVSNNEYKLHPVFRVFKKNVSSSVSGMVSDTLGAGIAGALVEATSVDYSTGTLTDSIGEYMILLPSGTYDISASAASYSIVDTTYTGVLVDANSLDLAGFDFVLQ